MQRFKCSLALAGLIVASISASVSASADAADGIAAAPAASPTADAVVTPPTGLVYKGLTLQLGGFLASEMVYRANNTASDIATAHAKNPFGNSIGYGTAEFRGTERQSRFSLLAQGDSGQGTRFSGYYELDFLGTAPTSNANESNSYTARTRNVYLAVDWVSGFHLLAGQNWSLITANTKGISLRTEALPATIDAQYAVGFQWARQWQLRVTQDICEHLWGALSFEEAQTVGVAGTAAAGTGNTYQLPAGASMSANMSFNSYPDVIAKLAWEPGVGHFEIYNLLRNFQSSYGGTTTATQTNKQSSWTDAVGGNAIVPLFTGLIDLSVSGLYGKGAARYATSTLNDATFSSNGSLNPLNGTEYLAQVTWHATKQWDAYMNYGQETVDSSASADSSSGFGDGVVADNSGCNTLGGTCSPNLRSVQQGNAGTWWSFYKGTFGVAKLGLQYSHTILDAFRDSKGFSANTTQDMAFTSLRYYPF